MKSNPQVQAVRHFNRFYTKQIGVLQQGWLGSTFSLTEARVLYELARRENPTATEVGQELGVDAGYLSRMLRSLEQRGAVQRTRSIADGRSAHLSLTPRGQRVFARLNEQTEADVATALSTLSAGDRRRLVSAMQSIEDLLGAKKANAGPYVLRPPHAGDLGWIVHRQGAMYAEEWGYNEEFEALVAEIVGEFVKNLRPKKERCWIAERDGEIVGSIFLVRKSDTTAKLRLLYVEASARGMGIGAKLIGECVRFAKQAGYRKVTLWTQSELKAARRLYKKAGFRPGEKRTHNSFGRKGLVAETWNLEL